MIRNENFCVKKICDKTYILPVGQAVADTKRGISINQTGEFIWNELVNDMDLNELTQRTIEFFEATESEEDIIKTDVKEFVNTLKECDMVLIDGVKKDEVNHIKSIVIAGIKIGFYGDKNCFPDGFDAFEIKEESLSEFVKADLRIEILHSFIPKTYNGKVLIRNSVVETMECDDRYVLKFTETKEIVECHLSKDGMIAKFYTYADMSEEGKTILFHAVRCIFLYRALLEGIAAIHSASIRYKDKVWLFSASSGTGKSTHAALWNKLFATENINGDLNLIGFKDDKAYVYGLPWCGTSGIFNTKTYELGGIILLKRNEINFVEELKEDQEILLIQQRIISPSWDEDLLDRQLEIIEEIVPNILVARLNCTADDEAANVMKEYIDRKMGQ